MFRPDMLGPARTDGPGGAGSRDRMIPPPPHHKEYWPRIALRCTLLGNSGMVSRPVAHIRALAASRLPWSGTALEQAGDRPVAEHFLDGPRDQRRDRQHGELVEALLRGDRQRAGDDD